ncbi:MAG: hypothetical protein ACKVIQ_05430 [Acidimicrobiales bacterium]
MQIPTNNSSSPEGLEIMSGMATANDTGVWREAVLGETIEPGMVNASLAPSSLDAPQTFAKLLPTVEDEAPGAAVVLPAPPAPVNDSADFGQSSTDTDRAETDSNEAIDMTAKIFDMTTEQKFVLIGGHKGDDNAGYDSITDSAPAHGADELTDDATSEIDVDEQDDVDISISCESAETHTLATPQCPIAEVLDSAEALKGSLGDVLADSDPLPEMDDTPPAKPVVDARAANKAHDNFNAAVDEASKLRRRATEVLNHSQVQAQKLLDSAQRRAAATVSQGDDQASRVIESGRERAIAIVSAAQDRADELIANITDEVNRIEDDARILAHKAIEMARQDAKAKATEIAAEAITDSQMVVANCEERAHAIIETASDMADGIIIGAEELVIEIKSASEENLTAANSLADKTVTQAEQVLSNANGQAEELRQRAEQMLATIERIRANAQADVAAAAAKAAEQATVTAQGEAHEALADSRREAELCLSAAAAAVAQADNESKRLKSEAMEEANTILSQANERAMTMTEQAMADADSIGTTAQSQIDQVMSSGRETSSELVFGAQDRAEDIVQNAQLEAEQIRNEARKTARRMVVEARCQVETIEERESESKSFSAMWDSTNESPDDQADEFFAGMDERDADEVFNG